LILLSKQIKKIINITTTIPAINFNKQPPPLKYPRTLELLNVIIYISICQKKETIADSHIDNNNKSNEIFGNWIRFFVGRIAVK